MDWSKYNNSSRQCGQSVLELLVAMAVFVLVVSSIMFLTLDGHSANQRGRDRSEASWLAHSGAEAVRQIQSRGWRELTDGTYGLQWDGMRWGLVSSPDRDGDYTRSVTITAAERDEADALVETGGTADFNAKRVVVTVSWPVSESNDETVTVETLLTNWRSLVWHQTTQTEFDAGTYMDTVSQAVVDGEIVLVPSDSATLFGNAFRIDAAPSAALLMRRDSHQTALCFTAPVDEKVASVLVYIHSFQGNQAFRYGLQALLAGTPSGTWVDGQYVDYAVSDTGWVTLNFTSPPNIAAGQPYCVIVQGLSGASNQRNVALRVTAPNNAIVPFDGSDDPNALVMTSTNSGSRWSTAITQPLFLLRYEGGGMIGNPYDDVRDASIRGADQAGSFFTPAADVTVSGVAVVARRGPGATPNSDLIVTIAREDGAVLASGSIASGGNVGTSYAEYSYAFNAPITLTAGTPYRLFVSSAVTNNSYYIQQLLTDGSADHGQVSYGGEVTSFTSSSNGGSTWSEDRSSDWGGYSFTASGGYATSGEYVSPIFDTASGTTVYNYFDWSADVPAATTVGFQLRTARNGGQLGSAPWLGPDGTGATYFTIPGTAIPFPSVDTNFIQYRALFTGDGITTPTLSSVTINYEP